MKNLYRRYRPLNLDGVVGQDETTKALAGALKAGKISHAYLFVGPRGCGKTSVARIFAHEVNDFKYELEDEYVDIIEIDGASNRGIDNIRELREKALIAPTIGKYKIYIIDEVHMLTKEAFNALLKTLEEPPEHVIFIMATTDAYKVPVTITSRAQTYTFKLAEPSVMANFLKSVAEKEGIKIDDAALGIIAKRGGGSFRDSLSLLDQISTLSDAEITKEMVVTAMGLPEDEKIAELLNEYLGGDVVKITTMMRDLLSTGVKPETLAEEMVSQILENPRPEFLPLLEKLAEVKDPFAEARLLVSLTSGAAFCPGPQKEAMSVSSFSSVGLNFSSTSYTGRPAEPPLRGEPIGAVRNIRVKNLNQDTLQEKQTADIVPFDWNEFVERVRSMNDAISAQLNKCEHETRGNALYIFPRTKIIRSILARENNKEMLINAAGGRKIEIREVGERPESAEKDETLDKISGIMGGEVLEENGGSDPF